MQTGLMLTPKALMPKLSRINPLEGVKRIFSVRAGVELLKATAKVCFLSYFVYSEYTSLISGFPTLMGMDASKAFFEIMKRSLMIGIKMGAVLGIIAAADYFYQKMKYEKDLMMTKQEVKEEYKQLEGDPKIKGKIRQKQRQMSRMRMMKRMKEADVVITNPTHYAVAVRYKQDEDKAPMVLAKGKDVLAQKIKEKAREYGIEIVENRPVAQALYHHCDIEAEIPRDMYQAVAEILVYVYRMKNKTVRGEHR
jgi:flagellar biosynthetic protein FlhB